MSSADSEFIVETVLHPWYLNSYFMNVSEKGFTGTSHINFWTLTTRWCGLICTFARHFCLETERNLITVQAGRLCERACCSGVKRDYALKSSEMGAVGAT